VKIIEVKAGSPTSQVNHGSSEDMEQSGKSSGSGYLSATKGCVRTICVRGVAKQASCVDHIKAKAHGGTDEDSNLESLCWSCHAAKTARERLK